MSAAAPARVLFVDDEPMLLSGIRRTLGTSHRIETMSSAADALAELERSCSDDPFAVIVSDMMMPTMNGAEFLRRAHLLQPDAVLIILSGQADLNSTIAAVNNSILFRFLTKPCAAEELRRNVDDALRQHRLVTAERELLELTLLGAVDTLMKVLAVSNPATFGRANRVARLVEGTAGLLGVGGWELRVAALLSQIGCVAVPETIIENLHFGAAVTADERSIYGAHPDLARDLIAGIPRLERVAEWIGTQPVDGAGPAESTGSDSLEPAILHAAIDFLGARDSGRTAAQISAYLRDRYPADVVNALIEVAHDPEADGIAREVLVADLRLGMLLHQDVHSKAGMILVRSGERVDETLLARLRNFARSAGVVEPVRVLC